MSQNFEIFLTLNIKRKQNRQQKLKIKQEIIIYYNEYLKREKPIYIGYTMMNECEKRS